MGGGLWLGYSQGRVGQGEKGFGWRTEKALLGGRRSNRDRQTAQRRKQDRKQNRTHTHKEKRTRKKSGRRLMFVSISFLFVVFGFAARLLLWGGLLHSFSSFQSFHTSPIHPLPFRPRRAACSVLKCGCLPSVHLSRLFALLFFPSLCFFVSLSL